MKHRQYASLASSDELTECVRARSNIGERLLFLYLISLALRPVTTRAVSSLKWERHTQKYGRVTQGSDWRSTYPGHRSGREGPSSECRLDLRNHAFIHCPDGIATRRSLENWEKRLAHDLILNSGRVGEKFLSNFDAHA